MSFAIANEDRLPHDRAVWRDEKPALSSAMFGIQVSVDYGAGLIEQTLFGTAAWPRVKWWRFGWAQAE